MGITNSTPESTTQPASTSEPKKLTERPEGIEPLNDSVWEFYSPHGIPEVDIIFFHGLQLSDFKEAFWKTWLSRDGTVVWPQEWLSKALPNARILSVCYDSLARRHDGGKDLYVITENLLTDIVLSDLCGAGQNCPVVLVGHSLGGIVIKNLLLECSTRIAQMNIEANPVEVNKLTKFLGNCKGVFYYSTPHGGSKLANYAKKLPGLNEPIVSLLQTLCDQTSRINNSFRTARARQGTITQAIGERLPTKKLGLGYMVVEEASARVDTDGTFYTVEADHIDVCKPTNTREASFSMLQRFIANTVLKGQVMQVPVATQSLTV